MAGEQTPVTLISLIYLDSDVRGIALVFVTGLAASLTHWNASLVRGGDVYWRVCERND